MVPSGPMPGSRSRQGLKVFGTAVAAGVCSDACPFSEAPRFCAAACAVANATSSCCASAQRRRRRFCVALMTCSLEHARANFMEGT